MSVSQTTDITRSLEICANNLGDIVPQVYQRFFQLSAPAQQLMGHSDDQMRGRMFEQTLELLMTDDHFGENGYLDWELDNHLLAYQVDREMYEAFFAAITDVVREGTGDAWGTADAAAWQARTQLILDQVYRHPGSA
ncbi:MAG: globin [Pseudomonadota bacterium]